MAVVKAPSRTPWGTPLFSTTGQLQPGSRSGWTGAAAVKVSADTSLLPLQTRIAGPIIAFTAAITTTGSLAGQITTPPLPSSGECMFPGTTSMLGAAHSSFATPLTTV